jgi:hypothetical protein
MMSSTSCRALTPSRPLARPRSSCTKRMLSRGKLTLRGAPASATSLEHRGLSNGVSGTYGLMQLAKAALEPRCPNSSSWKSAGQSGIVIIGSPSFRAASLSSTASLRSLSQSQDIVAQVLQKKGELRLLHTLCACAHSHYDQSSKYFCAAKILFHCCLNVLVCSLKE